MAETTTIPKKTEMPAVSVLFSDAWALSKKIALPLIGLSLIQFFIAVAIIFGAVLLSVIIMMIFGLGNPATLSNLSNLNPQNAMQMFGGAAAGVGLLLIAVLGAFMYLGSSFQASMVHLVAKQKEKREVGLAFSQGFKYGLPILGAGLLTGLLVSGGTFLLLLPGLVMALMLGFVMYEIVVAEKKIVPAIQSSVSMVTQNFWAVLGRWALMLGVFIIFSIIIGAMQEAFMKAGASGLSFLFSLVTNFATTIFAMAYTTTLYNQVKAASVDKKVSMTWMIVVAAIGWVLGVLLIAGMVIAARNVAKTIDSDGSLKKTLNEMGDQNNDSWKMMQEEYSLPSSSPSSDAASEMLNEEDVNFDELLRMYQEAQSKSAEPANPLYESVPVTR